MVVGKAPVAARGALRALKPRAAPWRRGEGSVARACILPLSATEYDQVVVGYAQQFFLCQCHQILTMHCKAWNGAASLPVAVAVAVPLHPATL